MARYNNDLLYVVHYIVVAHTKRLSKQTFIFIVVEHCFPTRFIRLRSIFYSDDCACAFYNAGKRCRGYNASVVDLSGNLPRRCIQRAMVNNVVKCEKTTERNTRYKTE